MNNSETAATKKRYNRIAPLYDAMEWFTERAAFQGWRKALWARVPGQRVLEVGVGTGKNFDYHPVQAHMTGIDLSNKMLARARKKAEQTGRSIDLREMDVQQLEFADNSFDAAAATFVFCSVPDPVLGLRELARVVKPEGRILLLEHVRLDQMPIAGTVMDVLDPLVVRVMGAHINRRTVETVQRAGLTLDRVEDMSSTGLVKLITACPQK
ncbi:MAG: methyltransferase domain-containing protein [Chloroflexi bacterium]|nr:MAG: methyltransferase domain-containing protein [Chloroflexota bacterium]